MQRQKSILLFLKKPQGSGGGKDVYGEATSLKKVPRQTWLKTAAPSPLLRSSPALNTKLLRSEGRINASTYCRFKGGDTSIIQYLTDIYRGPIDIGNGYLGPKHLNKHKETNASKTISFDGKVVFL